MNGAGVHCQVNKIVGNVEARRTRVANVVEVGLAVAEGTGVDGSALGEKNQLVEKCNNVGARLMDGEDDGSVIRLDEVNKTFNNVESVEGIETTGGLVEEENTGAGDKLASDANSAFLTTRDTAAVAFFGPDKLVADVVNTELSFNIFNLLQLRSEAHLLRQTEHGAIENGLMDSQSREHGIILIDKANDASELVVWNFLSVDQEVADDGTALVLSSQNIEEGGFASTRSTHNSHELARMNGTLNVCEDLLALESIRDVFEIETGGFVVGEESSVQVVLVVREVDRTVLCLSAREEPDNEDDSDNEQSTASDDAGNERCVYLLDRSFIARDICDVQTLSRVALERDAVVSENVGNEVVHGRFRELAAIRSATAFGRDRCEASGTLDVFFQKVSDVNRVGLATEHATGDAAAFDVLAMVRCRVAVGFGFGGPGTGIEGAVERLLLIDPD